jgi:poly-gamma-glutamate synthesis protein (capsule biosynthesis protein)
LVRIADIAITNLEAPLLKNGKAIKKTGPAIKASPETIYALKYAGFNLLTLANNHIMDYGELGLRSTLDLCQANGISTVGAGINYEKASETFYIEIKGIKISILNFAENEWSTTNGSSPGAHPLNPLANFYKIREAKEKSDFVIVIIHGGHELYTLPSPRMKLTYRFFADAGADAIFGHHPHCFSGYELYKNSLIFYSLGNFLFEPFSPVPKCWYHGLAIMLKISKVSNVNFDLIPYSQSYPSTGIHLIHDKINFLKELEKINSTINDDFLLQREFEFFVENKLSKLYKNYLEPMNSIIFRLLKKMGIKKTLLSAEKKRLYLNLIRCESHRDVIIHLLDHDRHT